MEWTSNEIPARSFISMDIVWNPTVVWSTREILQFTDNRNFKKDVAIILKSIDRTQNTKTTLKKSLAIKSLESKVITKKLSLKSPSPRTKSQRSRLSTLNAVNGMSTRKDLPASNKNQSKKILGTSNRSNCFANGSISMTPQTREKENVHPKSPENMSVMLDSLKFTPVKTEASNMDYLASLPTPNSHFDKQKSYSVRGAEATNHIYQNLNETETILMTPLKINDQTTVLESLQTPVDRTEVNNSRYFDSIHDRNQFAMQKTPAFNSDFSFNFQSTEPTETLDMFTHSNRRSNMDISPQSNISIVINRTQTLSSPSGLPKLSMIEEEQSRIEMSETYVKQNEHHLTYNLDENVQKSENLVRDVRLIATPLSKKYLSMKELTDNNSNLSLEQKILKINQGSMPNLHKLETVKSIENNRYFCHSIEKDLQETENEPNGDEHNENLCDISSCSIKSTASTLSVAFNEHEIQAQSSRINLNEIGQSKPSTKMNYCFTIDKPNQTRVPNRIKYLSASSPTVNKIAEKKPKLSQSIRDINSTGKSRPSVISYASCGSLNKKRIRDEHLDSSRKSINKLSPPKRLRVEPESPKMTKGQSFRTKTWGGVLSKKFRIPSIPPQRLQLKRPEEERVILYNPELSMRSKSSNTIIPQLKYYATFFFSSKTKCNKKNIFFRKKQLSTKNELFARTFC